MASLSGTSLRPAVIEARERLRVGRERIARHHRSGLAGAQVSTSLADLIDGIVLSLWESTLDSLDAHDLASDVVLVAHGGFGRRDLAPYSDVDLMAIPKSGSAQRLQPVASQLTRDIVDAGLQLGFTIRGANEACRWAWRDATIFSSLSESRLLAGSFHLYQKYFNSLRRGALRRQHRLIQAVNEARREERHKWGETNYLLNPNVKRSRGGLRDIQLIRWVGFASHGETDLERLVRLGSFPQDDYRRVRAALAFMLRLRNELHFSTGKNQDVLDRNLQVEIAERWGYQDRDSHLAVEWFMKDYFEHSRNVRYAVAHYLASCRHNPLRTRCVDRIFSRAIDHDIRSGPYHIWVRDQVLEQFARDLPSVLRLMDHANRDHKRIGHRTWHVIREAMMARPIGKLDQATGELFLSLLSHPGRLPSLLRRLHELRILEKIIPAMHRARGMLEFNQYHKYTVDAHSIRAVEAATRLAEEDSLVADVYRGIRDKRLLHLALLLHDLGKGYEEDHSIVGSRIARETCPRLGLDAESTEIVARLIELHLEMNNTSARHDLSDPEIVSQFATTVGSMRMLDMLLVHSVADMTAVGPGVLSDWKLRFLEELYVRTRRYFDSGSLPGKMDDATEAKRQQIRVRLRDRKLGPRGEVVLSSLRPWMFQQRDVDSLTDQIAAVAQLPANKSVCWHRELPNQKAFEYTVVRRDQSNVPGLFSRLTGTFTSRSLGIRHAEIATLDPDIAWDTFVVTPATSANVDALSCDTICAALCSAVDSEEMPELSFPNVWKRSGGRREAVLPEPTRVNFDNETFDRYTVLSLFAYDRPGLLYSITQALAEESIVTHFAKISTHLDQVVDVFYVTRRSGERIENAAEQARLRLRLSKAVAGED